MSKKRRTTTDSSSEAKRLTLQLDLKQARTVLAAPGVQEYQSSQDRDHDTYAAEQLHSRSHQVAEVKDISRSQRFGVTVGPEVGSPRNDPAEAVAGRIILVGASVLADFMNIVTMKVRTAERVESLAGER